jgi:hypothetical protein
MTRGEEIRTAIQHRDTAALRKMADEAPRREDRMFLDLLAELVDLRPSLSAHGNNPTATGARSRA